MPAFTVFGQSQEECANPPPGKTAVLFTLTNTFETIPTGGPKDGKTLCILVDGENINSVSFGHLVGGKIFKTEVGQNDVTILALCPAEQDFSNEPGAPAWTDDFEVNGKKNETVKAAAIQYELVKLKENIYCGFEGPGATDFETEKIIDNLPIRYEFHDVKEVAPDLTFIEVDKYLHYISSKTNTPNAPNEEDKKVYKDICQCELENGATQDVEQIKAEANCPATGGPIDNGTLDGIQATSCAWIQVPLGTCQCKIEGEAGAYVDVPGIGKVEIGGSGGVGGIQVFKDTTQYQCINIPSFLTGGQVGTCEWSIMSGSDGSDASPQPSVDLGAINTGDYKFPADYIGPLAKTPCAAHGGYGPEGGCRNINDLLLIFIQFGNLTLGVIGTFAFVFFVYGGFVMITSFGNSERVKRGRDILIAAIVGILISFSAYALINFMLDALSVGDEFRGIK